MKKLFFLLGVSIYLVGCSSATSGSGNAVGGLERGITGVVSTASSKITEGVPGGATVSSSVSIKADIGGSYASTDIQIFGPGYFTTAQTYIQYVLNKAVDTDPSDGMGLISRFKQKIASLMCPIVGLHPDANADGIPDVGTGTLVLPNFADPAVVASITSKCPEVNAASLVGASGTTIGYVVTDVSGESGSQYSIKSVIDMGNNGSPDNIFYYKADGAVIRFAFAEVSPANITSITLFEFDGTTLKFDFHGGNQDGHYRMIYNTSTKDVTVYSFNKNDANNLVYMTLIGNRSSETAALTLTARKAASDVISNGQGCITATGSTFPWSANFTSGGCGSIVGASFAIAPGVLTFSEAFTSTPIPTASFDHTDKILFSNAAEVLTAALIQ
jgi:hypothetical protein